ncbi:MAG: hypothetical protein HYY50_05825 [Candidatus Kerfeldbacteria bacterium]|nr:hypothetical protein [Candidatus Kerfeldbacteria bacterium]
MTRKLWTGMVLIPLFGPAPVLVTVHTGTAVLVGAVGTATLSSCWGGGSGDERPVMKNLGDVLPPDKNP